MASQYGTITLSNDDAKFNKVLKAAEIAFKQLYKEGSYSHKEILANEAYRKLIEATATTLESNIVVEVPDEMREYLAQDVFIFSGLKAHAQLTEAHTLLRDDDGGLRPYYQFEQDVLKLNTTYNKNYLEAEYEFAAHSSQSAARWANLQEDTSRYNLQYRTAGDDKVRDSHAKMNRITLPKDNKFWDKYYPPNGWRCRCIAVEVMADTHPATDGTDAITKGEEGTTEIGKGGRNKAEMFRFNPGKSKKIFPPANSYTKVTDADKVAKKLGTESN